MQKKLTVLFAFAIFVLVVGWAITPAQAGGPHAIHGGGRGDDVSEYDVMIGGDVTSSSNDTWFGPFPSRKIIGRGFRSGPPFALDLSFFTVINGPFFEDRGEQCFGSESVPLFPQAFVQRGGGGRAEGHLWFEGCTDLGRSVTGECVDPVVLYVLKLFGSFESPKDWPPAVLTNTLTMNDWAIEREGQAVVSRTCLGGSEEGDGFEVTIDVTPSP